MQKELIKSDDQLLRKMQYKQPLPHSNKHTVLHNGVSYFLHIVSYSGLFLPVDTFDTTTNARFSALCAYLKFKSSRVHDY